MGLFNFGPRDRPRRPAPDSQFRRPGSRVERDEADPEPPRSQMNATRLEAQHRPRHEQRKPLERENGNVRPSGPHPKLPGSKAVRMAKQHLAELTGQVAESVSGLTPTPDGGWKVILDLVELERIPQTTDVMASYELELDAQGELVGYRRISRYYRNQVDEM